MVNRCVKFAVVDYPGALQSAIHGFQELFSLGNQLCQEHKLGRQFSVDVCQIDKIVQMIQEDRNPAESSYKAIILPPSIGSIFCSSPDPRLKDWLVRHHSSGAIICSVCAGAFILASSGLLCRRVATTHWELASKFSQKFPEVITDCEKILINDGDIITAGGLMAWVDLGLELVAQFAGLNVMHKLSRLMIVDSGLREQRYYQSFSPKLDHGDKGIIKVQHYLQTHFSKSVTVKALSDLCCLSERTFLRRFEKSTGLKPIKYLQKLRVQKACDLLETTDLAFGTISEKVGYEDISALRKVFVKTIGLTPRDFKKRFVNENHKA
ncbi:MAG: helix-turn-helix domain-containing protein [Candidatus Riflebacteria bacterium]|nr:helix-turn-helix domain-containing protein [Candidatus Riflebacteria bacterium]